jgi:hypothetical protein
MSDVIKNTVVIDWRRIGDFSAVGQLTEKLFSTIPEAKIYQIEATNDGRCRVFRREGFAMIDLFGKQVAHDAALNFIAKIKPDHIYYRISPVLSCLEFATKVRLRSKDSRFSIHYMDKPDLREMSNLKKQYVTALYDFLLRHADKVFDIHRSAGPFISKTYGQESTSVANFFKEQPKLRATSWNTAKPIRVAYFGSIDSKMNSDAISEFCEVICGVNWVELLIWTNSGLWGRVKDICESSSNIRVEKSNLSAEAYEVAILSSDLQLLPYNTSAWSRDFLQHSYSNKVIDYISAGGMPIAFGPGDIPVVRDCIEKNLGPVCHTKAEIADLFASKEKLLSTLERFSAKKREEGVQALYLERKAGLESFRSYFSGKEPAQKIHKGVTHDRVGPVDNLLAATIRQKFLDLSWKAERQSIAATILAHTLSELGYDGFKYEI